MRSVKCLTYLIVVIGLGLASNTNVDKLCKEKSCTCGGGGEEHAVVCNKDEYCVKRESEDGNKFGCVKQLDFWTECKEEHGCVCLVGKDLPDARPLTCTKGTFCVKDNDNASCVPHLVEGGGRCPEESKCHCSGAIGNPGKPTQHVMVTCSPGEFCANLGNELKCVKSMIKPKDISENVVEYCQSTHSSKLSILCPIGFRCQEEIVAKQPLKLTCVQKIIKAGEKCEVTGAGLICGCMFPPEITLEKPKTASSTADPYTKISQQNFCAIVKDKGTVHSVQATVLANNLCKADSGCLCSISGPSTPQPLNEYVPKGHYLFWDGIEPKIFEKMISKDQTCGDEKKGCGCSLDPKATTVSQWCFSGQVCYDKGGNAACGKAQEMKQNGLCENEHCMCIGAKGKSRCNSGEWCGIYKDKGICYKSLTNPEIACTDKTNGCICARDVEPNQKIIKTFGAEEFCAMPTQEITVQAVSEIINAGEPATKYAFMCKATKPGTQEMISTTCGTSSVYTGDTCVFLENKLECGFKFIAQGKTCYSGKCLCRLNEEKGSPTDICGKNTYCHKEGNKPVCIPLLEQSALLCEKAECACNLPPAHTTYGTRTVAICKKDEVCLITWDTPICRKPLGADEEFNPEVYPNGKPANQKVKAHPDDVACVIDNVNYKKPVGNEKTTISAYKTILCPKGTLCGKFGNYVDCQYPKGDKYRNVISVYQLCTNRAEGCLCRRTLNGKQEEKHCRAGEKCDKDLTYKKGKLVSNVLTCEREYDGFFCPKGLVCYCGPATSRNIKIDQWCVAGKRRKYYDEEPVNVNYADIHDLNNIAREHWSKGDANRSFWFAHERKSRALSKI